jgi:tRNA(Arg) A34 adenosine deaminase TadA
VTVPTLIAPGLSNRWRDPRYNRFQQRIVNKALACIDYEIEKKSYHVSVITERNRIIAIATNDEDKTDPRAGALGYYGAKQHSEYRALKGVIWKPSYRFFNVRCDKSGNITLAKPCRRCATYLRSRGIARVYYTDGDGFFDELML